ncbi:hypothetical protein CDAR_88131 [Caerostris darwini]|uniref:Cytochrome P450 n=1 Tax=Caerostris darwini TaxID=1538125 RepID=A0AAV4QLZ4_9ARAC|nr:hypothetical protein CDAR_88131 [Caerostris darwini]
MTENLRFPVLYMKVIDSILQQPQLPEKLLKTSAFAATQYQREQPLLWHHSLCTETKTFFPIQRNLIRKDFYRKAAHIPECAYIPFAAGPRDCIGRVFAEMEVKILVCHILRNFSLHSLDSRDQVLPIIKLSLNRLNPPASSFDADNSE